MNNWNPARFAFCTCGWTKWAANLKVMNTLTAQHLAEGCEGCDHAIALEEDQR